MLIVTVLSQKLESCLKWFLFTEAFYLTQFFVSALLRDYSLCCDPVNGTWLLHLTRPCLVTLGQVLIRVCHQIVEFDASPGWEEEVRYDVILSWTQIFESERNSNTGVMIPMTKGHKMWSHCGPTWRSMDQDQTCELFKIGQFFQCCALRCFRIIHLNHSKKVTWNALFFYINYFIVLARWCQMQSSMI